MPGARREHKIVEQEVLHLFNQIKADSKDQYITDIRKQDRTFTPTIEIVHASASLIHNKN